MEEYSLIGIAELENVTSLLRVEALDVAQCDHRALVGRELLDRLHDQSAGLAREQPLLGIALPRLGQLLPAARVLVALGTEAVGLHRRLVAVADRGERNAPALAL